MAGELRAPFSTGQTCYFLIFDRTSQIWNGSSFVAYAASDYADYAVSATELDTSAGIYKGTFPSSASAGIYDVLMKQQLGGSVAQSDPVVASQDGLQWNGTVTLPLSDIVTSGQFSTIAPINIARGIAYSNFGLYLKSASDHITPFVSGTISGQIARDSGSFGPLQSGNITEVGLGWYNVNFTSGDLNAATVKLVFTGVNAGGGQCDPLPYFFLLQRVSGG